jgi:hypothetical protein
MNPELAMKDLSQSKYTRTDYVRDQVKKLTDTIVKSGGKIITKVDVNGDVLNHTTPTGLPRKTAKRLARQTVLRQLAYTIGNIGQSEFAKIASRRERRQQDDFQPQYNGNKPKTFSNMFGIGYERFNNKFVKIK